MSFFARHLRKPQTPFNIIRSLAAACHPRLKRESVGDRLWGLPIYASWNTRVEIAPGARLCFEESGFLKLGVDYSELHAQMPGARVALKDRSTLAIRGLVDVHQGSLVWGQRDARISIGNESFLSNGSRIISETSVSIGAGCAIAWDVTILDTDFHHAVLPGKEPVQSRPIEIGDNVWIGANAIVLKGTRIGSGSIVSAGAVVKGDFAPNSLISGVPARTIRDGVRWY